MSYNISRSFIVRGSLRLLEKDARSLIATIGNSLPNICFLNRVYSGDDEREIPLTQFSWAGDFSGHSFDLLITTIGPKLLGEADVVFIWEDGDYISGLRFSNGVVTKCDVSYVLTPKR